MDLAAYALQAAARGQAGAFPLAFFAGFASCAGPCVAPRFLAVTAIAAREPREHRLKIICAFAGGLVAAYALLGATGTLLLRVTSLSSWIYAAVAAGLTVAGVLALWNEPRACSALHRHVRPARGGAFLLGGSFALVVSPCCAPLIAGAIAYASTLGNPAYGSALLAVYAAGHTLPLFAAAAGGGRFAELLERVTFRYSANVVGAALTIALGLYYAVLA